jgi:uncharacterized membrane protein YphA (DoxX/SURF4 family)
MSKSGWGLAAGAILLGSVCLAFGDFALQWQPVPAGLPLRTPLAYLAALILLAGGVLVFVPRTARIGAAVLAATWVVWAIGLHLPRVIGAPTNLAIWLGLAEITALAAGALTLLAMFDTDLARGERLRTVARMAFGVCGLVFGASHFVYAAFTAQMVPGWMPAPLFWAYATGVAHGLAGLAIFGGVQTRLAAGLLTAMCGVFIALVHIPRVLATPSSQAEWTALGIASCLCGAAWVIRQSAAPSVAAPA